MRVTVAKSKRRAAKGAPLRAVPTKACRAALMSRYRRLKIEGGAFFYALALADRGENATDLLQCRGVTLWA